MKHDSLNRLLPSTEKLKLAWRYIESKEEAKEREQLEKEKRRHWLRAKSGSNRRSRERFAYKFSAVGRGTPKPSDVDFDYPLVRFGRLLVALTHPDNSIEDIPVYLVRDTAQLRRCYIRAPWKIEKQLYPHHP